MKCNPVQHFVFDQKYCKKGESRGKHTAAERVDASGDLVELVSLVLVNCMHLPVPFTLCRFVLSPPLTALSLTGAARALFAGSHRWR